MMHFIVALQNSFPHADKYQKCVDTVTVAVVLEPQLRLFSGLIIISADTLKLKGNGDISINIPNPDAFHKIKM